MARNMVSSEQIEALVAFMEANTELALGRCTRTTEGRSKAQRLWREATDMLNSVAPSCPPKEPKEWRAFYSEFKSKLLRKIKGQKAELNKTGGGKAQDYTLTPLQDRLYTILGRDVGDPLPCVRHNPLQDESIQPPVKVFKSSNFAVIKRCCISLVRDHGRPVEMFDDQPFRELVNLLPLTSAEKHRISAEFVQKLVDGEDTDDDDMDITADKTADDQEDDGMPIQQIKGEMDVVVCACKDGSDGDHEASCPAVAASTLQTYWNYFEVSMDEAKCTLCQKTITWTSISKLKEHLQVHHPNINFLDDDEEFEKGPPSSAGSREDLEQVYVDPFDENILKKTSKKRKKAKQQLLGDRPITRENIASSLDRFKSLDCFGNYVASLMKLIPKDKCVKFQIQIVERLLHEQAAAA